MKVRDKINTIVKLIEESDSAFHEFIAAEVLARVCKGSNETAIWKDILTDKLAHQLHSENKKK